MHNPEIERRAHAYLVSLGGAATYTRGEVERHLVAFAEGELRGTPCVVCGGDGWFEGECEGGTYDKVACPLGCAQKGG